MSGVETLIKQLNLSKHPEGGYFGETYRSETIIPREALPGKFSGSRNICTSIYFLLPHGERSLLHRILSDEIWHYHAGSSLSIYVFSRGKFSVHHLGPDLSAGEKFQVVVPAGAWFGAICNEEKSFTLAGCTVSPGFDFKDFELAKRQMLLSEYPQYQKEIELLTNAD